MDEVSVTSLLSSRRGAIPSEFTDTLADTTRAELSSELAVNAAFVKPKIGSRIEATQTQNRQVLRKATIQATFKDLYEIQRESLVLRPAIDGALPSEDAEEILASPADWLHLRPWVADSEALKRGRLAEVEVELQADPLFRVSSIVSSYAEIAQENEDLAMRNGDALKRVTEINRMLEKLMVGLVPIRARLLDYQALSVEGGEYLVHQRIIDQVPASTRPLLTPAYLVGVAEQDLFWKDLRRVLFSKSGVRVLCRLNYAGLRDSWTPVKLIDVLGEVAPDLAREVEAFGSGALRAMAESKQLEESVLEPRYSALVCYGTLLAVRYGLELDHPSYSRLQVLAGENCDLLVSVSEGRLAFRAITQFVEERLGLKTDPVIAAQLRMQARQSVGLLAMDPTARSAAGSARPAYEDATGGRFLDAEFVAIYW